MDLPSAPAADEAAAAENGQRQKNKTIVTQPADRRNKLTLSL
jgi:hypothetical protein